MKTHVVRPGDWIGAIAAAHGFAHWSKIWDHPCNEQLREMRGSPDLLLVGDAVRIPELDDARGVRVQSGRRVEFRVRGKDVLRLRLVGLRSFIAAFGPVAFVLEVGNETLDGVLEDAEQELCVPLEASATRARLTLMEIATYEFAIGGLGPVEEREGAHARLLNLGFGREADPGEDARTLGDSDPISATIVAFQRRNDLEATGELDDRTQARIRACYEGRSD